MKTTSQERKNMAMEFPDKLAAFTEVDDAQIQPDTHFRYTYEKYQGHGEISARNDLTMVISCARAINLRMNHGDWTPAINTRSFDSTSSIEKISVQTGAKLQSILDS